MSSCDLRHRLDNRSGNNHQRSYNKHSNSRPGSSYSRHQGSSHSRGGNPNNNHHRPSQQPRFYFRNIDYNQMTRNEVLEDLVTVEKHHIESVFRHEVSNKIEDVKWCPEFVERGEYCTGGAKLPHHKCRECNRIAIHLVDKKGRPCLRCFGWHRDDIPSWYYHKGCSHCA